MRKRSRIFSVASLIASALTAAAYSQDQVISRAAFEAGMRNHSRPPYEWRGKARKITKFHESRSGILREVSEYDAAGSSRRSWQGNTNGQPVKQQSITVGSIAYNKMGDAKWTWKEKDDKGPAHLAPFERDGKTPSFRVVHEPGADLEFRVGAALHKGRDVLVYTRINRFKHAPDVSGKEAVNITITSKFWLGQDGRVVRYEQWDNHQTGQSATTMYLWTEWELDPGIVIRAPIIEP
jgi:hypothetical protein